MSGEGGPFLIVDRRAAESWTGSLGDYDQVLDLGPAGGPLGVSATHGIAWEPEGGATAHLYRLDNDSLLLQREWADAPGAPPVSTTAEVLGAMEVPSGALVVLWSPVAWEDLWDPPAFDQEGELGSPSMVGVGHQVLVSAGSYTCWTEYSDDVYRCWITRT